MASRTGDRPENRCIPAVNIVRSLPHPSSLIPVPRTAVGPTGPVPLFAGGNQTPRAGAACSPPDRCGINSEALLNTSSSIWSVSLPVKVFCWDG